MESAPYTAKTTVTSSIQGRRFYDLSSIRTNRCLSRRCALAPRGMRFGPRRERGLCQLATERQKSRCRAHSRRSRREWHLMGFSRPSSNWNRRAAYWFRRGYSSPFGPRECSRLPSCRRGRHRSRGGEYGSSIGGRVYVALS